MNSTREWFEKLSQSLFSDLKTNEDLSLHLKGEDTEYLRFTQSKIRQMTFVKQRKVELTLQTQHTKCSLQFDLGENFSQDLEVARIFLERARSECQVLPKDDFLSPLTENSESSFEKFSPALDSESFCNSVLSFCKGLDLVGFLTNGKAYRAFTNSKGSRHWFCQQSSFLDYSLYTETKSGQRKALKNIFCDPTDSSGPWLATLAKDKENLDLLALPEKKLAPAKYRTYFAPAAASDLVAVLSWSALSLAAYKQKRSPFKQLIEQQTELSPKINLIEDFKLGLSPRFNFEGELAPENLPLIEAGKIKNLLVNQAAAKEHGAVSNGADVGMFGSERLRTAVLASGNLPEADILQALDTGIYVNNLHYLNWSNLHTASITGMTRYACFWVENGKIVSPITDLRFDDSFYNFWGPQLLDLTEGFEIQPNTDTYVERSLGGSKVPGVLVKEFNFVL